MNENRHFLEGRSIHPQAQRFCKRQITTPNIIPFFGENAYRDHDGILGIFRGRFWSETREQIGGVYDSVLGVILA